MGLAKEKDVAGLDSAVVDGVVVPEEAGVDAPLLLSGAGAGPFAADPKLKVGAAGALPKEANALGAEVGAGLSASLDASLVAKEKPDEGASAGFDVPKEKPLVDVGAEEAGVSAGLEAANEKPPGVPGSLVAGVSAG